MIYLSLNFRDPKVMISDIRLFVEKIVHYE